MTFLIVILTAYLLGAAVGLVILVSTGFPFLHSLREALMWPVEFVESLAHPRR